jgi:hypothetical protein
MAAKLTFPLPRQRWVWQLVKSSVVNCYNSGLIKDLKTSHMQIISTLFNMIADHFIFPPESDLLQT